MMYSHVKQHIEAKLDELSCVLIVTPTTMHWFRSDPRKKLVKRNRNDIVHLLEYEAESIQMIAYQDVFGTSGLYRKEVK